jgi:hypothetical protein
LAERGQLAHDAGLVREVGILDAGADAEAALVPSQGRRQQAVQVDQVGGSLHVEPQQIDDERATGDEAGLIGLAQRERFVPAIRRKIVEISHAGTFVRAP